ncbi:MBL fold metallo-hydrolase [Aquisalimonas sp. 2447]|uniref:MBL fold metallo-hydrolase n=1 Tax=Aquisalimonas sp. 2447 TaxID=2740807 RepID=UPI0014327A18|nr:MBL fold metallo-hydrolase [Aquisalimonas sp. 2447]QIT55830.1 MBL fold metallo-hydrolase [Aquisalimonas sp. 2447]
MTSAGCAARKASAVERVYAPEVGKPLQVADGIILLRLPLPLALDHVNTYLLDEGDGWAVVDTGLDTPAAREHWRRALRTPLLRGRPVRRVIATHHHPDHIGLAGWLCREWDAPLEMTAAEHEISTHFKEEPEAKRARRRAYWITNGVPADRAESLVADMPDYQRLVHELPDHVAHVDESRPLRLGGRDWRILIGKGHSPHQMSLFTAGDDVLLAADQVLPGISPNIGVWPNGAQNPLHDYLRTLQPFAELGDSPLVLPGHRSPFRGLAARVGELVAHHHERLERLHAFCTEPTTCYEALPAVFDRKLAQEQVGFAMGEGLAHLHYLHTEGGLELLDDDGVRRFRRT